MYLGDSGIWDREELSVVAEEGIEIGVTDEEFVARGEVCLMLYPKGELVLVFGENGGKAVFWRGIGADDNAKIPRLGFVSLYAFPRRRC